MAGIRLSEVNKAATLLKKVVDRADVFKDGALSREEIRYIDNAARGIAARYVIDVTEAKSMVTALKNLYPARQKAVLTELAERTAHSAFGCAAVSPQAKPLFDAYAKSLGLTALKFRNPAAPAMPPP